jgi:hypothetical protein
MSLSSFLFTNELFIYWKGFERQVLSHLKQIEVNFFLAQGFIILSDRISTMEHLSSKDCLILDFLRELYPDSSQNTLRSWIRAGRVCVDTQVVSKASLPIRKGASISVGPKISFLRR